MTTGYHEDTSTVSRSMLSVFAESPRIYEATYITKQLPPTVANDNMVFGTVTHAELLEPETMDRVVIIPESALAADGSRRGDNWKAFKNAHADKILVKRGDYDGIQMCAKSIRTTLGNLLTSPMSKREHQIYWNDILNCRMKADLIVPSGDEVIVIDIKTAADVSPAGFRREVWNRRLWLQDAHYTAGAYREFNKPARFIFAAVEKTPPFRCRCFELDDDTACRARGKRRELLERLSNCYATGNWSDDGEDDITTISIEAL